MEDLEKIKPIIINNTGDVVIWLDSLDNEEWDHEYSVDNC